LRPSAGGGGGIELEGVSNGEGPKGEKIPNHHLTEFRERFKKKAERKENHRKSVTLNWGELEKSIERKVATAANAPVKPR